LGFVHNHSSICALDFSEYPTNHVKTMMGCQWEGIRYW
jgi:hypothetical protein